MQKLFETRFFQQSLFYSMDNKELTYPELVNKEDFIHKLRLGEDQIYGLDLNDINLLSFLCDNAFSNEASPLSKRCIDALNVFQSPVSKFLLKESSLFETYFSSFSQSTPYRMCALSNVLGHFLASFADDVYQLLNNSDIILPTLLHHLQKDFVQDFFYRLLEVNPNLTTKLFSSILRATCGKAITDEHMDLIIKKSSIDERNSSLIPICLNFLHPNYVSADLSSVFEVLIDNYPINVLKLSTKIARNDKTTKFCINICCEDTPFTQEKVLALLYLTTFPTINCTKIIKNLKNHFFNEKTNSMLHCAVVKFIKSSLDISELKKSIIQNFENEIQKVCNNDNNDNILIRGHCFSISQELNKYISSSQWYSFAMDRLYYWNEKTSTTKSKKTVSTFSIEETDSQTHLNANVNDFHPKFDFISGININDFMSQDDDLLFNYNSKI